MSDSFDSITQPANSDDQPDNTASKNVQEKNEVVQMVDRLINTKRITYNQYQSLSKMVLADGTVDEQERRQINRLFDAIQAGAIRIVD